MELDLSTGSAVIRDPTIDKLIQTACSSLPASEVSPEDTSKRFQIGFISSSELSSLTKDQSKRLSSIDTEHLYPLGIARCGLHLYLIIVWNTGYIFRRKAKLPAEPFFYITLSASGERRLHERDTINSLIQPFDPLSHISELLDHLSFALLQEGDVKHASQAAEVLCSRAPQSEKGWIRYADSAFKAEMFKLAMLSYTILLELGSTSPKLKTYARERVIACSASTEWGAIFLDKEIEDIPGSLLRFLLQPWSASTRESLRDVYSIETRPTLTLQRHQRLSVIDNSLHQVELPSFFRWLVPFTVGLMSAPRSESDIALLVNPHLGIRHIISLTDHPPIDKSWLQGKGITQSVVAIPDFQAPSIEQIDCIMELLEDANKWPALIHCSAGIGRTGTVTACYLVAYGFAPPLDGKTEPAMSAAEAIAAVRSIRPGSVETSEQERLVERWASTIWRRKSVQRPVVEEPPPSQLEILGEVPKDADLLILCGLQGAGKSWFARALRARDPKAWKRVSQDESGSRAASETDIGRDPNGKRVILDRCNPNSKDRAYWLKLAHWSAKPVFVWFDYHPDICISRAQRRLDHPTLPPGPRVRTAVLSTAEGFDKPSIDEDVIGIAVVRSFEACKALVDLLSPPVLLFKFPRTTHILNLGAATSDDLQLDPADGPAISALPLNPGARLVITEKIDGANVGFSLDANSRIVVQNRAHWVNSKTHFQFKKLDIWVDEYREDLHRLLAVDDTFPERYVLFGEWMVCTHSIPYTGLPGCFLVFDLYDRVTASFASRDVLEDKLGCTRLSLVPVLEMRGDGASKPTDEELKAMVQRTSQFYDGKVEGIYLKVEREGKVIARGKVVRGDFIAGNEHWTRGKLTLNGIVSDYS